MMRKNDDQSISDGASKLMSFCGSGGGWWG